VFPFLLFSECFQYLWSACRYYTEHNLEVWHKWVGSVQQNNEKVCMNVGTEKKSPFQVTALFSFLKSPVQCLLSSLSLCIWNRNFIANAQKVCGPLVCFLLLFTHPRKRFIPVISFSKWRLISVKNCMNWFDFQHLYRPLSYTLYITFYFLDLWSCQ
jgi:amino acid permease